MTLLDHGQPADTTTKKHHTGLIAVLAILAVALLAAGGWLFVDSQQQPTEQQPLSTEQQRAILNVVNAHRDALNLGSHDADARDAILATLTDDFTTKQPDGDVGMQRDDYAWLEAGASPTHNLSWAGAPVFYGDLQVAIPARYEPGWGGTPATDLTYFFTLREVGGQLKIATIVRSGKVYWYPDLDGGWSPR